MLFPAPIEYTLQNTHHSLGFGDMTEMTDHFHFEGGSVSLCAT